MVSFVYEGKEYRLSFTYGHITVRPSGNPQHPGWRRETCTAILEIVKGDQYPVTSMVIRSGSATHGDVNDPEKARKFALTKLLQIHYYSWRDADSRRFRAAVWNAYFHPYGVPDRLPEEESRAASSSKR